MVGELSGLKILITRQAHAAESLITKISYLGGTSVCLPLFAIEPLLQPQDLNIIQLKLQTCALVICISRNAAELVLPYIQDLPDATWAAIGPGTAGCLQQYGIKEVIVPSAPPYDSRALMQALKLTNLNLKNQYIIVLTGEQGDNWLQAALMQQTANVEIVPVYKRIMPSISNNQFLNIFNEQPAIDIILITCVTSLVNLIQVADTTGVAIRTKKLLVVSQRIYLYAIAQGFTNVDIAQSMSEDSIIAALS